MSDPNTFANTLDTVFAQFGIHNHSATCEELLCTPHSHRPTHSPFIMEDVCQKLGRSNPGKEPGPDSIPARVLKLCAMELSSSSTPSSGNPIGQHQFPPFGETSTIIQVTKNPHPYNPNQYKPVALTPQLDPNEFVYRCKQRTEDAVVCCVLHSVQHLQLCLNSLHHPQLHLEYNSAAPDDQETHSTIYPLYKRLHQPISHHHTLQIC